MLLGQTYFYEGQLGEALSKSVPNIQRCEYGWLAPGSCCRSRSAEASERVDDGSAGSSELLVGILYYHPVSTPLKVT